MALALLREPRGDRASHQDRGLEVDPDRSLHLLRAEVLEPAAGGQGGVGNQAIDIAGALHQLLGRPRLRQVGDERAMPVGSTGKRLRQSIELLCLAGAQDEHGAVTGELIGDRSTDTPGGAAEQHRLALEFHGFQPIPPDLC